MGTHYLHQIRRFASVRWPELAFGVLAVLVLWQALLPGYVLTLDMIWTPHVYPQASHEGYWYLAPWQALLWLAHLVVPVWLIQKVVLFGTLWAIPWSAYRFLPVPGGKLPRFIAGVFFLINPFVYARFVAGHQLILAAYALLPFVFHLATRASSRWGTKEAVVLGLSLGLIGTLSPHMLVVAGALATAVGMAQLAATKIIPWRRVATAGAAALSAVVLLSSYWVVPLLLRSERLDQRFDRGHMKVFSAAARPGLPLAAELLWLGGFWAERREWSLQYRWPQDGALSRTAALALAALIGYGALSAWRGSVPKRTVAALGAAGVAAYILAAGVSLPGVAALNEALFRLVPFWSGFRDSTKWIGLLAVPWAVFLGSGFAALTAAWPVRRRVVGAVAACILIWAACYPMIPGFWGRVRAVEYPDAWEKVKEMMDADAPGERTLFLPWHRYFVSRLGGRLDFPAYFYYGPDAVTNRSLEVGGVGDTEADPAYRALDRLLTDSDTTAVGAVRALREQGIVRIVLFTDLLGFDNLRYRFLEDQRFTREYTDVHVRVFSVPKISPE